jgi:formate dehydrogenase subunit delta
MREKDLVRMLNQIAAFHGAYPRDEAVAAAAKHVRDFWDPRMRASMAAHLEAGGEGLSEIAKAAAEQACATAPRRRVA